MPKPNPPIVPVREPEAIQADANRNWFGSKDKVPTTTLDVMTINGIKIESRYSKADEMQLMVDAIYAMPKLHAYCIARVFCDSKQDRYEVWLKPFVQKDEIIANEVADAFASAMAHYSGIWFYSCGAKVLCERQYKE
jgi:hypothetical protein